MNGGNLDIPDANGWAKSPARVVADPAWRRREKKRFRWAAWLAGLAAVSLIGAGVMMMLGHEPRTPAEAPLITADPSPVRIRPDDPGGLRVPNLDKTVYDQLGRANAPRANGSAGARVESLLPPPEAPRPLPEAVRPAPPPALPAQPAALAEGPSQQQLAREPEQPAAPAQQAARTPPAPQAAAPTAPPPTAPQAAATPAPVPAGNGRIQVQLAAVPTEQAANAEWQRLQRRMPDLLGNQRLVLSRGEREGQPFFRIRTGAFADNAAARGFCDQVRARGGSCFVAPQS
jgi:hypothetical protein